MTTDLKKLAEEATPGPWENRDGFVRAPDQGSELRGDGFTLSTSCAWVAECTRGEAFYNGEANAEYIAAANPKKILELLQEVETLRADREDARTTFNRLLDELRDLKAQLARHEEAAPQDLARLYDEGYHGLDGDPSISEDSRHRHALKYVVAMSTPQDGETKP